LWLLPDSCCCVGAERIENDSSFGINVLLGTQAKPTAASMCRRLTLPDSALIRGCLPVAAIGAIVGWGCMVLVWCDKDRKRR
jgi:hypothetical protein